jgi:hypothetical protein
MRNCFYKELRWQRSISDVSPEAASPNRTVSGEQEARLEMRDFGRAFEVLGIEHREALLLVGAGGLSYTDAAEVAGCAVGTMKSTSKRLLRPHHAGNYEKCNSDYQRPLRFERHGRGAGAGTRKTIWNNPCYGRTE